MRPEKTGFPGVLEATWINFWQAFLSAFIFTGIPAIFEIGRYFFFDNAPPKELPMLLGIPVFMGALIGGCTFLVYLKSYLSFRPKSPFSSKGSN